MKIFQKTSKIASKTQNCGKTRANWAKPLFIQVSVTPNRVESVKISHSPANFFHFVNQCYYLNFKKTQLGIRPEFINFSNNGIPVKIKRVSNTGRHKIIDTESSGGNIKILSNSSTEIPSGSAHITFNQKYTYVYGDNWIIE